MGVFLLGECASMCILVLFRFWSTRLEGTISPDEITDIHQEPVEVIYIEPRVLIRTIVRLAPIESKLEGAFVSIYKG